MRSHSDENRLTSASPRRFGCPVNCSFCLTGRMGLARNLTSAEIVGQVRAVWPRTGRRITNIVLMGIGEPLPTSRTRPTPFAASDRPDGIRVLVARITLSTAGSFRGSSASAAKGLPSIFAVSLNATTDETPTRLIPINRKWPIDRSFAALRAFPPAPAAITIEYVLRRGERHGRETPAGSRLFLLKGLCKVNLIPFNPLSWIAPTVLPTGIVSNASSGS